MTIICHIQLFSVLTGVQNVSLDEFKCSFDNSKNLQYHLICKEDGEFSRAARDLGVKVHYIPTLVRQISPFKDLTSLYAIYLILIKIKCQVVHTHSSKTGILGRFAAFFADVNRVVHTVHGFSFPSAKYRFQKILFVCLEFFAARCTDSMIVMNMEDYNFSLKYLLFNKNKIHLLSNSCRYKVTSSHDINSLVNLNLAFMGRLDEQKNPFLALDAFAMLVQLRQFKNSHLYIIGDGPLKSFLVYKVKELGLEKSITFCGWQNDIQKILKQCQVLLCTSKWEGFPLVVGEGASFGCIPLMTNIPGYRDLHDYHRIGFLSDEANYAETLLRLCNLLLNDKQFFNDAQQNLLLGFSTLPSSYSRFLKVCKLYETN